MRYEICVCIQTGDIVWWNGPFAAGEWPDLSIARHRLINMLDEDEMAVADGAYCDGFVYFHTPTGLNNLLKQMKSKARARHETVNGRLKTYAILQKTFCHDKALHGLVFAAIINIVQ